MLADNLNQPFELETPGHLSVMLSKLLGDGIAVQLVPLQERTGPQVIRCTLSSGGDEVVEVGTDAEDAVKKAVQAGWSTKA